MNSSVNEPETGLDPENWEAIRQLGHQMVDDMVAYLQQVSERPVWHPIPEEVKATYRQALPHNPMASAEVYQEFKRNILPYPSGNIHPQYYAWVQGGGSALGALADFMASTMNGNVSMGDQSALYIENQVLSWCKQLLAYPAGASGLLTSGASMANLTALVVARNQVSAQVRVQGLYADSRPLVAYCSSETHTCVSKAIEVMGLGSNQLRKIPVNDQYQISTESLLAQLKQDREDGLRPFCIIGNAGTVNTGATDDLSRLREICTAEQLWFHIDGAFGALAKLVPAYAVSLAAIETADSLTFDLHKWMYMPYEVGCVLIANREAHRNAFATPANYLLAHERGLAGGPESFSNYGIELSRGFKALKVWMLLKHHGAATYASLIEQNIQQASYLASLVTASPQLELLAPVPLNIVCFRYRIRGLPEDKLNSLNKELLMQIQERGIAAPSYTLLQGRYAIRCAITNHRTRRAHLEELVRAIIQIGDELATA